MDSLATSSLCLCQASLDWERIGIRIFKLVVQTMNQVHLSALEKAITKVSLYYSVSWAKFNQGKFSANMGRKNTEIVLLGFQTISRHVQQNRRLITTMLGRSFPVTSKTIGQGRFSAALKKILQSTLPAGFGAKTTRRRQNW